MKYYYEMYKMKFLIWFWSKMSNSILCYAVIIAWARASKAYSDKAFDEIKFSQVCRFLDGVVEEPKKPDSDEQHTKLFL